jgi:hypothetical protein
MHPDVAGPEFMQYLIHWAGFLGAWLLVAGPMFQASLELREETFDRESFHAVSTQVEPQPPVSGWWWLLPPVAYVKNRRRAKAERDAMMRLLPVDEREKLVGFMNKANGWAFVALGAFFIALKETFELAELYEAPIAVFWIAVVVMSIIAIANTVIRQLQAEGALHVDDPGYAERMRAERAAVGERMKQQRKGRSQRKPADDADPLP